MRIAVFRRRLRASGALRVEFRVVRTFLDLGLIKSGGADPKFLNRAENEEGYP